MPVSKAIELLLELELLANAHYEYEVSKDTHHSMVIAGHAKMLAIQLGFPAHRRAQSILRSSWSSILLRAEHRWVQAWLEKHFEEVDVCVSIDTACDKA